MTDKSYKPPWSNYLQPLYLSVTLHACAQRGYGFNFHITNFPFLISSKSALPAYIYGVFILYDSPGLSPNTPVWIFFSEGDATFK